MTSKFLLMAAGCLVLSAGTSSAISIVYSTSTGVQPANVGKIILTEVNPNTVDVLLDLISTTYGILNTGGPHTPFAFTIAGTETGVTASFTQPVGGVYPSGVFSLNLGGGDATPFGTFGIAIDLAAGNGSGNAYYGDLQFQLTRPTGLTAADFIANANGVYFAADLTDGRNTGSQGWSTPDPRSVPEGGATLALLGATLAGISLARRAVLKRTPSA